MNHKRSQTIFARAQEVIPGGVNSPVRACRSVGGDPVFVAQGDGATKSPNAFGAMLCRDRRPKTRCRIQCTQHLCVTRFHAF